MCISRRQFLTGLGTGAAATLGGCASWERFFGGYQQPNIIYILADDLGYGDLGCYGQQRIKTPHLDEMAAEGVRFTQHYAGSTVCAPSRCVLLTGQHTGRCRIRGNARVPLESEDITVAERLRTGGYTTGLVGKWGLGEPGTTGIPNRQGFDYFFGYLNQRAAHNYYPDYVWENEQKFHLPNIVASHHPGQPGGVSTNKAVYSHDLFVDKALGFIEQNWSRPFFLYLALTIPHANNEAGKKGMEVPDLGPYAARDWPEPQKAHAAMITRMDADIGTLLQYLKDLGIDGNTVVMFSSDNGPHAEGGNDPAFNDSNGPLRGIKRDLYEGGIRVPFIVRWPGRIKPGGVSDHVSGFQDMMPTLVQMAGGCRCGDVDGISLLPALTGSGWLQQQHPYLYWEFTEQGGKQAVRKGKWKAVRLNVSKDADAPIELYDLSEDIGETNNIADRHPDVVRQMRRIMQESHMESDVFKLLPGELKKK